MLRADATMNSAKRPRVVLLTMSEQFHFQKSSSREPISLPLTVSDSLPILDCMTIFSNFAIKEIPYLYPIHILYISLHIFYYIIFNIYINLMVIENQKSYCEKSVDNLIEKPPPFF
jgi:hypothetical protein